MSEVIVNIGAHQAENNGITQAEVDVNVVKEPETNEVALQDSGAEKAANFRSLFKCPPPTVTGKVNNPKLCDYFQF